LVSITKLPPPTLNFSTETYLEGRVTLHVPILNAYTTKNSSEYLPSKAPVFYNPLMSFNRDIAVLVLNAFHMNHPDPLRICDPLCGCGVRGIRLMLEGPPISQIVFNDRSSAAISLTEHNLKNNHIQTSCSLHNLDANILLNLHAYPQKQFDYIDLDPFGTPAPFLESSFRATKKGGVLAVTATDMAPLCGVKPEACQRKYFAQPLRTEYCHELAIRIVMNALVLTAAKHELGLSLLYSHYSDHYVRVYVQTQRGIKQANNSINNLGYVTHCFHCLNRRVTKGFTSPPLLKCELCHKDLEVSGPLWTGPLADKGFCQDMLSSFNTACFRKPLRLANILQLTQREADLPPTYFVTDRICQKMGVQSQPKNEIIRRLIDQGYRATPTHFNVRGIKTDASINAVKNIIRTLNG
jgi:tRNA (guanine26-N2/guanine27-N2)-dimethyltransferase